MHGCQSASMPVLLGLQLPCLHSAAVHDQWGVKGRSSQLVALPGSDPRCTKVAASIIVLQLQPDQGAACLSPGQPSAGPWPGLQCRPPCNTCLRPDSEAVKENLGLSTHTALRLHLRHLHGGALFNSELSWMWECEISSQDFWRSG